MDTTNDNALPGRLRGLRKQREPSKEALSQKALAQTLGLPYNTYSNWERGLSQPNADNLRQLALYFGVSVDYLLGLTDHPSPSPRPPGDHPQRHEAT